MITLSESKLAEIIEESKAALVEHLIKTRSADLELLEKSQVTGILNLDYRTWGPLIPRVVIAPGVFRWKASRVAAFINGREEA